MSRRPNAKGDAAAMAGAADADADDDAARCARARAELQAKAAQRSASAAKRNAALALSATVPAILSAVPTLVTVRSIDIPVKYSSAFATACAVATAAVLLLRLPAAVSRAAGFLSTFSFFFAFIGTGQEIRRCVTDLCDHKTLYGSADDCLSVCYTEHAKWHKFSVGATAIALAFSVRLSLRLQALVEGA